MDDYTVQKIEEYLYSNDEERQEQVLSLFISYTREYDNRKIPEQNFNHRYNLEYFDEEFIKRNIQRIYELFFKFRNYIGLNRIINISRIMPDKGLVDKKCADLLANDEIVAIKKIMKMTDLQPDLDLDLVNQKLKFYSHLIDIKGCALTEYRVLWEIKKIMFGDAKDRS